MLGKRGMVAEEVIFYILNLVFVIVMMIFISNSSQGKPAYQQAYAKEIALMIDEAKPTMTLILDMSQAVEIAGKSVRDKKEIVKIDIEKKEVKVKLKERGGYIYKFFSDAKISYELQSNNYLVIRIEEKNA